MAIESSINSEENKAHSHSARDTDSSQFEIDSEDISVNEDIDINYIEKPDNRESQENENIANSVDKGKSSHLSLIEEDPGVHVQLYLHREIRLLKEELKYIRLCSQDQTPISIQELKSLARDSILKKLIFPADLLALWMRTRDPRSLGGASYSRIIEAWEQGGSNATFDLISRSRASNYIKANAFTALARYLQKNKDISNALWAAKNAYEVNPRPFRAKWYAFRLAEAGYAEDAEALLELMEGKISFSEDERRRFETISSEADIERERSYNLNAEYYLNSGQDGKIHKKSIRLLESRLVNICLTDGLEACFRAITLFINNKRLASSTLIHISRKVRGMFPDYEYALVKQAYKINKNPNIICAFFWAAQRAKKYLEASRLIVQLSRRLNLWSSKNLIVTYNKMKSSMTSNLQLLRLVGPDKKSSYRSSHPKRICYILHNSLPYSSGGYATRANGVARALKRNGYDVHIITRAGYPYDIAPLLAEEDLPEIEEDEAGIIYHRIFNPKRNTLSLKEYVIQSADRLEETLADLMPELVIAASNHITGLPALIAARRLGIPFIYEVRGLWEITRSSRESKFRESAAYHVQSVFEAQLCKKADLVFTLTKGLKDELINRGADGDNIVLAPNACDPERFEPCSKDPEIMERHNIPSDIPVIGYVGTFVVYEGLEDLATACGILKRKGREFRLLLVGNENATGNDKGEIVNNIESLAQKYNFSEWLIMPGRVPHDEARKYYSVIDIAPFPRKPWEVCEIVSPMKPMEAMAMEKAVIVSSVRALTEMAKHGETGLVFEKGNVADLTEKLETLMDSPDLRKTIGRQAREYIRKERTWSKTATIIANSIERILADYEALENKEDLEESSNQNTNVEVQ